MAEQNNDLIAGRNAVSEALRSQRSINKILLQEGAHGGSLGEILPGVNYIIPINYQIFAHAFTSLELMSLTYYLVHQDSTRSRCVQRINAAVHRNADNIITFLFYQSA